MNAVHKIRFALLFAGFLLAILLAYFMFLAPWHALPESSGAPLPIWSPLPLSTLLAGALATLVSLFTSNRHRLRAVLRPNRWRVLTSLLMAGLTPFVVYGGIPWIYGGLMGFALGGLFQGGIYAFFKLLGAILASSSVLAATWYLPSALIISGVKRKILRVGLFALLWWGTYSTLLLIGGSKTFNL